METTSEILAELEEIGATGKDKDVPIRVVEEVSIEGGSPSPQLLDVRGEKMIELSDLVIAEFDRLIESAQRIRAAVTDMRDMWKTAAPVEHVAAEPAPPPAPPVEPVENQEALEVLEEAYPDGVPSPLGTISLSIPEAEPLPPEVANLTDADLSMPPPAFEEVVEETSNEGEDDAAEVSETT